MISKRVSEKNDGRANSVKKYKMGRSSSGNKR
jgi:hypothetical protein